VAIYDRVLEEFAAFEHASNSCFIGTKGTVCARNFACEILVVAVAAK
jgi:hypothetical protein